MTAENVLVKPNQESNNNNENKQPNGFSNLRILLVDDQHTFIVMMRSLLSTLGFSKIDVANSPEHALKFARQNTYDIYIFDYNLGEGLNGRQLMENLHKTKRIPPSSIVLIVTGDNSRAMVLSAVEQEPDDYIIKPFSLTQFKERLVRAMNRRKALADVFNAIYENDNATLIEALTKQINSGSPFSVYCRCLLANSYVKENNFDLAKATLNEGLSLIDSSYLHISLGKVLYEEKLYEEAIEQFEQVLQKHPLQIEALKYLTFSYLDLGQEIQAMQTIKRAVLISPMSTPLLQLQIEMALKGKDFLQARDAIGLLLEVNKYYPNEVENLLSSFVQCEFQFVQNSGDSYHIANIQKHIRNIISRYKKHVDPQTFNAILFDAVCDARIQILKGESVKGKRTLYKAYTSFEEPENVSKPLMGQMYLGFQQVGEYEVADQIKTSIENNVELKQKNESIASALIFEKCVDSYLSDKSTQEKYLKYRELNEKGINFYKKGQLTEALDAFKEALKKVPTNTNVMLNKVQVLIDMCEKHSQIKTNESKFEMIKLLAEAEQGLQTIEGLNLTEAQFKRTNHLRMDINHLKSLK